MQAGDVKLGKVFANDHQSVIPLFQRPYVWGEEKNWDPLWMDIRKATEEIEVEQRDDAVEHSPRTYFLGAVVVQERRRPPKKLASSNIIDGQQRLTTLQVLVAAARSVADSLGATSVAGRLASLVENRPETIHDEHPDDRYKVWPLPQDRAAFLWAVRRPGDDEDPVDVDHQLVKARIWFEREIDEWAKAASSPADRLEALHFALQDRMQLVEITLDATDDPQVIFEALNYRGVPLAAADLVKNLLFQAVDLEGEGKIAEQLLTDYWIELDGKHWRGSVTTGRIKRALVDLLLAYWLTIRSRQEVLVDHLFADFKTWMGDGEVRASDIIKDLRHYADTYRALEGLPLGDPTARLLDSMQATSTNTPWPVILYLYAHQEVPDDQRWMAAEAIDSYLMRRGICRSTSKDYTRLFVQVLEAAQDADPTEAGIAIRDCLATQTAESRLWPDDQTFRGALLDERLFDLVYRARMKALLVGLENHLRTPKSDANDPVGASKSRLNIEHVLPQKWKDNWDLDIDASDENREARQSSVHCLGNLTLASPSLNSSMSNSPWPSKKISLREHSTFLLTTSTILAAPPRIAGWTEESWSSDWDEARIAARSKWLANCALQAWPRPAAEAPAISLGAAVTGDGQGR